LDDLLEAAWHRTEQYANNRLEADHGRLKARLGPMRGLKQDRSASIMLAGHAFVQTYDADTTNSRSTSRSPACGSGIQRVGIGDLMPWRKGRRQHAAR
jgi:transposase-like protein